MPAGDGNDEPQDRRRSPANHLEPAALGVGERACERKADAVAVAVALPLPAREGIVRLDGEAGSLVGDLDGDVVPCVPARSVTAPAPWRSALSISTSRISLTTCGATRLKGATADLDAQRPAVGGQHAVPARPCLLEHRRRST